MRLLIVTAVFVLSFACSRPQPEASVVLTDEALLLGAEPVALLKDVVRADYLNVPPLQARLRELLQTAPTLNPCGAITAPPTATFAVLKRVLFSCRAEGLGPLGLRAGAGAVTTVGLLDPFKKAQVDAELTAAALTLHSTDFPRFEGLRAEKGAGWAASVKAALPSGAVEGRPLTVKVHIDDAVNLAEVLEVTGQLKAAGLEVAIGPGTN